MSKDRIMGRTAFISEVGSRLTAGLEVDDWALSYELPAFLSSTGGTCCSCNGEGPCPIMKSRLKASMVKEEPTNG